MLLKFIINQSNRKRQIQLKRIPQKSETNQINIIMKRSQQLLAYYNVRSQILKIFFPYQQLFALLIIHIIRYLVLKFNLTIIATNMKTSSSRERSATQNTTAKYSKPPTAKPTTPLENTNTNVAVIGKRSELKKVMPPKPPVKTKYNVEVNMTESKIFQAKQGLQLLKKKMNRTGMSRQKNYSNTDKVQENRPVFNRASSNQELNIEKIGIQNKQVLVKSQKSKQMAQKTTSKEMFVKTAQNKKQEPPKFIKPVINQYQDERPIAKSNNFMVLLQKQMKKQEKAHLNKQAGNFKSNQNKNKIFDENGVEIILQVCSKGCGRMFNQQTLPKHEKVCQKVFQSKRKTFNSAIHRAPDAQGFQPQPMISSKPQQKPKKKKNEIPKWKIQSAAFRAGIKLGKNQPLTKEEEAMVQITQQNRVCCDYCGRKFSEQAAKKHVPFCQRKAKQIGKNTMRMKR